MSDPVRPLTREPWVSKRELAAYLDFSTRWVELRVRDGMPSEVMGGRRRFKIADVENWLRRHAAKIAAVTLLAVFGHATLAEGTDRSTRDRQALPNANPHQVLADVGERIARRR